jgi:uncharacterized protein HemX
MSAIKDEPDSPDPGDVEADTGNDKATRRQGDEKLQSESSSSIPWWVVSVVAAFVLLGYSLFIYWLLQPNQLNMEDRSWARAIVLLGGVEAITFAAAGFFFGREVNRARAISAEQRADQASTEAKREGAKAAKTESRLKNLSEDIRKLADVTAQDMIMAAQGSSTVPSAPPTLELTQRLQRLAERASRGI